MSIKHNAVGYLPCSANGTLGRARVALAPRTGASDQNQPSGGAEGFLQLTDFFLQLGETLVARGLITPKQLLGRMNASMKWVMLLGMPAGALLGALVADPAERARRGAAARATVLAHQGATERTSEALLAMLVEGAPPHA